MAATSPASDARLGAAPKRPGATGRPNSPEEPGAVSDTPGPSTLRAEFSGGREMANEACAAVSARPD
jgi:hypothetical protein